MKTQNRHRIIATLIAGVLAGSTLGIPLLADTLQEEIIVEPGHHASAVEQATISRSAARALRHIAQARSDIHDNNLAEAKNELARVRKLIDIIKASRPTSKVIDHIWVAKKHLDYMSTTEVGEDLIPIESALADIEDLVPVEQARQHLKKAGKALEKGQKKPAREELQAVQDSLIYTEVDLPLANTEQAVIMAQGLLARNRATEADEALALAEDGVQFLSITTEAPLSQARKSIGRAVQDYAAKEYDKARAELAVASGWLLSAAEQAGKATSKKVADLEQSIQTLSGKLDKQGKDVESSLNSLWHKIAALSEHEAEKIGLGKGKSQQKTSKTLRGYLMDSKLAIAYAQTAQLLDHDESAYIYNLKLARTALKNARNMASKAVRRSIDNIEQDLDKVERVSVSNLSDVDYKLARLELLGLYEKTRSDLRKLIRDL